MDSKTQQVPMDALYQAEEEVKMCAPILERKRAAEEEKRRLEEVDMVKLKNLMGTSICFIVVARLFS